MADGPIPFAWDGEAMRPLPAFAGIAAARFGLGQVVSMAPVEERSSHSHRHYFACIREAWANLSDADAARFASAEHLRKYALIKAGYRNERSFVCASDAEARRLAAFIRPIDDYAVITVAGRVIVEFAAKSQSPAEMGKTRFQASKEAVLSVLAEMIGVEPTTLVRAGHRSAA